MKATSPTRLGTGPRRVGLTAALALFTSLALPAGAATIAVSNQSFEDDVLAESTSTTTVYAMTVAVGARLNAGFDADEILLRLGYGTSNYLTMIADNKFTGTSLTAGEFKDFSVSFTAQAGEAYLGENLAVLIGNANVGGSPATVTDFDSVRLTVIPEPSAALLGSIGCLLLLRRRR